MDPVACRTSVEEYAVSDLVSVPVTTQDGEVTFQFSNGGLPITATDVNLQVVYRGPLGDDPSAIAVGSTDISEPSFLTYFNSTDYIAIEGVVYTKAQVNSDPNLLSKFIPQACVDYSANPAVLKDSCVEPKPIGKNFTFGTGSSPVAELNALPVLRFARIAYLAAGSPITEAGAPRVTMHSTGDCATDVESIQPSLYTDGVNPSTGEPVLLVSPAVAKKRDVYSTTAVACVYDGGGNSAGIPASNWDRMAELPQENRTPWPVGIALP